MRRAFLLTLLLSFATLTGLAEAIVVGESATFQAKSDGASAYQWIFPGGTKKSGSKVSHTFNESGQFSVTLKVTGADGQANEITKSVKVQNGDRPTAIIQATIDGKAKSSRDLKINTNSKVKLEPDFSDQKKSDLDYFWNVNGKKQSGNTLSEKVFNEVGFYQVSLTVFDKNQTHLRHESSTRVVVENQGPTVSQMSVKSDKEGQVVRVTTKAEDPDGEIESYRFEVLENGRSVLSQLVNQPEASFNLSQFPGDHAYQFRVTVSDDRQRTTRYDHDDTLNITNEVINTAPKMTLVAAPGNEGTVNQWFNFLADATDADNDALRYQWIFPDGQQYFSSQVRYQFRDGGEKTIVARVTDGIETIEDTLVVKISEPPNQDPEVKILSVLPSGTGDTRTLFRLNALGTDLDRDPLSYTWDMGDGGKSTSSSPQYRYTEAGTYQATVTVNDGRAESTETVSIQVSQALPPVGKDPGTNNPPTVTAQALSPTADTNQSVRFTSEAVDIDVEPLTYAWDMGDGFRYFTPQVSHAYRASGPYEVTLVVSDGLAEASTTVSVNIGEGVAGSPDSNNQVPSVKILSVSPQLSGDTETIFRFYTQGVDPDQDEISYEWDMGNGQQMFIQNPAYKFTEAGQYEVQVKASDGLSQVTDQILINVEDTGLRSAADDPEVTKENQAPSLSITAAAPSTKGSTLTLFRLFTQANDPDGDFLEFSWDMGDGQTVNGQNPIYRYEAPGTYLVKATVTDGIDSVHSEVTLIVEEKELLLNNPEDNHAPEIALEAFPLQGVPDTQFRLAANAIDEDNDPILYLWEMGDGSRYFTDKIQHQYKEPGEYEVSLQATDGLGRSIASQTIIVSESGLVPDLFTEETNRALGVIEKAEFGTASCAQFLSRINQAHEDTYLEFSSAKIALAAQGSSAQNQLQLVEKWQAKANAAHRPLQSLKATFRAADWQALLNLGLEADATLRMAHVEILKQLKPLITSYKASVDSDEKKGLKTKMASALKLRSLINPEYNIGEDKPHLTAKKERLQNLQSKWQESLDFTTDDEKEADLQARLDNVGALLLQIEEIETQTRTHFMTLAQAELDRCEGDNIDPKEVATYQLINALADIEGTVDTTFFLYAKASENYSENALLFEWALGDARTSGGQNIYFKYPRPGLYEVELKISDELTSSRDRLRIRVYENWPAKIQD